jgi:hypothetical protein
MADPKSRFGALKSFREQLPMEDNEKPAAEPAASYNPPMPRSAMVPAGKGRGRPAGKRSNPDFEPTTVLLRTRTKRMAGRLLEDGETGNDLSDLIESLLADWISKRS